MRLITALQIDTNIYTALLNKLKQYDVYGHSSRVALISANIGRINRLPELEIKQLYLSALLHDIGKIKIPYQILHKPEQLNDDEWDIVKKHPVLGSELLMRYSVPDINKKMTLAIRYHHERYNGSGYPDGLSGQNIPIYSRIIAIADALDVMTSQRPYRQNPLSQEEAINELRIQSGLQFDPYLITMTIRNLKGGKILCSKLG